MTTSEHIKFSAMAADIVSTYPEITEEWRRVRLRAQIQQAYENGMKQVIEMIKGKLSCD